MHKSAAIWLRCLGSRPQTTQRLPKVTTERFRRASTEPHSLPSLTVLTDFPGGFRLPFCETALAGQAPCFSEPPCSGGYPTPFSRKSEWRWRFRYGGGYTTARNTPFRMKKKAARTDDLLGIPCWRHVVIVHRGHSE